MNKKGGYVYLLCDLDKERTYKIGVTRGDIDKRIKKLRKCSMWSVFIKYIAYL